MSHAVSSAHAEPARVAASIPAAALALGPPAPDATCADAGTSPGRGLTGTATIARPAPVRALTISRDVQHFDLLIEDMEQAVGKAWGDLNPVDALRYLDRQEAGGLEFVAIALDDTEAPNTGQFEAIIRRARALGIDVILVAEGVRPVMLHRLLRAGASDFLPYPLPAGALRDALQRQRHAPVTAPAVADNVPMAPQGDNRGIVLAVQPLAGGAGGTTLSVNLAWELAMAPGGDAPRVCLLDLDFQTGSVSTYLDLPRNERVPELLAHGAGIDRHAFLGALQKLDGRLQVLTAAADALPLDMVTVESIERMIAVARAEFDFVIIDMPHSVQHWTETVLTGSDHYLAMMEPDMRSAQNALRFIRALKAEALPLDKLRYVLNRAPRFTDISGKARARRIAESLDITFDYMLPDGAAPVTHANDHGLPLAETAPKNPLLKEIRKIAQDLVALHGHAIKTAA